MTVISMIRCRRRRAFFLTSASLGHTQTDRERHHAVGGKPCFVRIIRLGARAQLTLMPPEAYEPEPVITRLFDPQIRDDLNSGGDGGRDGVTRYA